jgi:hypothetical protein
MEGPPGLQGPPGEEGPAAERTDNYIYARGIYSVDRASNLPDGNVSPNRESAVFQAVEEFLPYGDVDRMGGIPRHGMGGLGIQLRYTNDFPFGGVGAPSPRVSTIYAGGAGMQFVQPLSESRDVFIFTTGSQKNFDEHVSFIDATGKYWQGVNSYAHIKTDMLKINGPHTGGDSALEKIMKIGVYRKRMWPAEHGYKASCLGDIKRLLLTDVDFDAEELMGQFPEVVIGGQTPVEVDEKTKKELFLAYGDIASEENIIKMRDEINADNLRTRSSGRYSINYSGIIIRLTQGMQEMYIAHCGKISELEERIGALEKAQK